LKQHEGETMNAPPFPTNPAYGQTFGNWVWNGSRWVCTANPGIRTQITVFNASAPYTPAPGLVTAVVECIGGGGAGGAISPVANFATWVVSTGGGGSGGYSRVALPAALVLGGVSVTIGEGGSGENGGGLATSFGALCVAPGGFGAGYAGGASSYMDISGGAGGAGGAIGGVTFQGSAGTNGFVQILSAAQTIGCAGGQGGTVFGGSGTGVIGPGEYAAGQAAWANTGAGGGGAMVNQIVLPGLILGGAGGSGICIVTEHCWADTDSGGGCCGSTTGGARVAIGSGPQGWYGQGFGND
jgi:hypothetical protein